MFKAASTASIFSVLKGPQATSALGRPPGYRSAPGPRWRRQPCAVFQVERGAGGVRAQARHAVLQQTRPLRATGSKKIRSRARNGNSERPLFPKRAEQRIPPAERPARRRHFFLAEFFLAIAVGGERWSSGIRGERSKRYCKTSGWRKPGRTPRRTRRDRIANQRGRAQLGRADRV